MEIQQVYVFDIDFPKQANDFIHNAFPRMTVVKIHVTEDCIVVVGEMRPAMCEEIWREYLRAKGLEA